MKNIEITHDCFVDCKPVEAGTILKDVDNGTAAELLTSGRAKLATVKPEAVKPEAVKPESVKPAKKAAKKTTKKNAKRDSK